MKTRIFSLMAIVAVILFVGCDKVKEATSVDVKVDNVAFSFITPVASSVQQPTGNTGQQILFASNQAQEEILNTFTVTRAINIDEIGSSDVKKYIDQISKVTAKQATVSISTDPAGIYTVSELKMSYEGGSSLTIPSYKIGEAFTSPSELNAYISGFVGKLLSGGDIKVTVSGKTDALVGTSIIVKYETDLVFTASIF